MIIYIPSEENLWSVLYLTGYLTMVRDERTDRKAVRWDVCFNDSKCRNTGNFRDNSKVWFDDSAKAGTEKHCLRQSGQETVRKLAKR